MLIFYAKFLAILADFARFKIQIILKEAQVLEQVNQLQAVKKAPFEADTLPSPKAQKQNDAQFGAMDFKNALQKSIQSTKTKDTPKDKLEAKSTKQSELNSTAKATLPSAIQTALPNTLSNTLSSKANPLAHKNSKSSDDDLLQNALHKPTSHATQKDTLDALEKHQNTKKHSNLNLSKTAQDFGVDSATNGEKTLQNALLKEKIAPKNALASSEHLNAESTKKHANALNSIAQNSTKAIHSLESSESLDEALEVPTQIPQDTLEKKDTQTPKKDLNQMARNKSQEETFLSKITQNQAKVANNADEAKQDELESFATPPSAQNIPAASTTSEAKINPQNLAKSLESSATSPAQASANPTLQNVANKANELGLNPSNIRYQESQEAKEAKASTKADEANATKKTSKVATQASQTSGVKTYFDDDEALRPVFDILESFDAKNAAKRRASNAGASIKYVQNGEDKIAVIERGKSLPKAITASRIKNERQEKIFEQIQKDLLAGKELNLSQIERELSKLEDGLFDDKTEVINPLKQTPKGIKPSLAQSTQTTAAIATSAGLSAASALSKDSKDSSKDSKGFASKSAKESKESKEASKASAQSTLTKEPSEPLSTQQRQEPIFERNLATPQFAQNEEQETFNETLLAQKAQKQESSEAKAESKSEAKTLTSNATSTNPLRGEARTSNINAREALSSFVNQFEQEVKKFKPPMRQISMELSPKELGNIELTITQRGNSLHIAVVSNPQALQLFAQNHGELRQNLLNAGFEGVDLSFSSSNGEGGQSGRQNQDSEQNRQAKSLDSLAQDSQDNTQSEILAMEITLPRYA